MAAATAQGAFMRRLGYTVMGTWFLLATVVSAQGREYFLPGPGVQAYAVILAGPSPDETYGDQIRRWGLKLYDILAREYGYTRDHIILLMSGAEPDEARVSGDCRKEIFLEKMKTLKRRLQPGDQLFFFLAGHGTSDEEEAKFVLTGPDISGQEFAAVLQPFSAQDIIVVNAAGSGFPFCAALTGPGRVIVSATGSGAEKYNTRFAHYFIAALADRAGDRDKNRRVSIWEAFVFATRNVEKWYADQNRIPTEHAMLEDSGDGIFSRETAAGQDDGILAQIAYLDLLSTGRTAGQAATTGEPGVRRALHAKIRELERSVFLLRHRKAEMPGEAYRQDMERLLIELARTSRQLRQLSGGANP
jgi:hypothetical protein